MDILSGINKKNTENHTLGKKCDFNSPGTVCNTAKYLS